MKNGDMKNGDVKAWLGEARRMERGLEALAERQRRYRELARGRRSIGMEALEREIGEKLDAYAAAVKEIEERIDGLEDPLEREVLRYRYLNGWSWQMIAGRMGFSRQWLWKVHMQALENLRIC